MSIYNYSRHVFSISWDIYAREGIPAFSFPPQTPRVVVQQSAVWTRAVCWKMANISHGMFIYLCADQNKCLFSGQRADLGIKITRTCLSLQPVSHLLTHTHTQLLATALPHMCFCNYVVPQVANVRRGCRVNLQVVYDFLRSGSVTLTWCYGRVGKNERGYVT